MRIDNDIESYDDNGQYHGYNIFHWANGRVFHKSYYKHGFLHGLSITYRYGISSEKSEMFGTDMWKNGHRFGEQIYY